MARAVILFVAARALVFADDVIVVFVNRAAGDQTYLFMLTHNEAIEIEARRLFLFERAILYKLIEVLCGLAIDCVRVMVRAFGQINLWARDVQETQRITGCERACLFRADNIVRRTRNFRDSLGWRTQSAKRMYDSHCCVLL